MLNEKDDHYYSLFHAPIIKIIIINTTQNIPINFITKKIHLEISKSKNIKNNKFIIDNPNAKI